MQWHIEYSKGSRRRYHAIVEADSNSKARQQFYKEKNGIVVSVDEFD